MAQQPAGRRDSRIHLQLRHSDALQEQEAFRRKYLLVNKHITKLNAGLNMRVEELNAQITQLNSENIALRAKTIELTRKLAAEQASTRRTIAEAESMASNAIRQMVSLRDAFANMASPIIVPPSHLPAVGPPEPVTRTILAKKPDVSFIRETSQEVEDLPFLGPKPEYDGTPSPPGSAAFITSRRTSRRSTLATRSSLPAVLPPLSQPTSAEPIVLPSEEEVESELDTPPSVPAKLSTHGKMKTLEAVLSRQKSPEVDDYMPLPGSTRRRLANKENDMDALKEESGEETNRTSTVRRAMRRRAVTPPPAGVEPPDTPVPASRVLHAQSDMGDFDASTDGLRERRARKSVNYAEPKLNTKMRKPEGYGEGKLKPRVSNSMKEDILPLSGTSSKAPSSSSGRSKGTGLTAPTGLQMLPSDTEVEMVTSRTKTRRHSTAL